MIGLKLKPNNGEFTAAARAEKLLVIPAGDNVVRLLPPLIIGEAEVSQAIARLDSACAAMEAKETTKDGAKA
jgi:acetylornithine/N-succinyldiaminopimelate aminotransferase